MIKNESKDKQPERWIPLLTIVAIAVVMITGGILFENALNAAATSDSGARYSGLDEAVEVVPYKSANIAALDAKASVEEDKDDYPNCSAIVIRDGVSTYQFGLTGSVTPDALYVNGTYYADEQMFVTWCSTRIIRHPKLDTWTENEEGLYVDADGYLAVASSFGKIGDIIEGTPLGDAKIYDKCPAHTVKADNGEDKKVAEVVYFVSWD